MRLFQLSLAILLADVAWPPLFAQVYPGQYPGQYPGTGGVGLPIPGRHKKDKNKKVELQTTGGMLRRIEKDQVILEADDHRTLNFKRTDATKFLKEGNPIKPSELRPGDLVEIESSEDDEGFMTAVNVHWQQDGTAKDREHASEPVETSLSKGSNPDERPVQRRGGDDSDDRPVQRRADSSADTLPKQTDASPKQADASPKQSDTPTPAPAAQAPRRATADDTDPADLNAPVKEQVPSVQIDSDDQGPPVLKRGGKAAHKQAQPAPASSPELSARNTPPATADAEPREETEPGRTASAPAATRPDEVALEKAREAAGRFLEGLPDYFCQEVMTRYQSETHPVNWRPLDVVSMALVYEHGAESYRNVEVNGKATKKNVEDLSGSWSTGEFGTVLADVLSPDTAADFEYRKESRSSGRTALLYDFSVEREHSHWRIMVASQLMKPSYKGRIWIDKETHRVLRIEMEATKIPEAFPIDHVETATDYDFTRIADRQFLVPVHAESLACQRGSDMCTRNVIDFRNYHKYTGESTITFQ